VTRRVVITGCGLVTAAGTELDRVWAALMDGTCFIRPLREAEFVAPGMEGLMGAPVELPASDALDAAVDTDARRDRCAQLALAAARRAFADAALPREARADAGVALGTTMGQERQIADLSDRGAASGGPAAVDAGFGARSDVQRLAGVVAAQEGLGGPVLVNVTACASGNAATAWAYDLVATGTADVMAAGGADTFTRLIYCGFSRMGALSKGICHPFDKDRDGVSFGEGAAFIVLEELEHARRRGARIYAELAGYGISNDAYHLTAPDPNGEGFVRAARQALATTGTDPAAVGYVSAHGTGTQYNDLAEARTMKALFGERAPRVPISSVKSMLGHTNGAASAIENVVCALALVNQTVPPTANLRTPDPEMDLDLVRDKGRPIALDVCLNLSAGFGGFNVCTVLKRAP
jgi:3-oxoacyl-[acyl-carrier-protein] synthase II